MRRLLPLLVVVLAGCGGPKPGEELEPNAADKGKASHLGHDGGAEESGAAGTAEPK